MDIFVDEAKDEEKRRYKDLHIKIMN